MKLETAQTLKRKGNIYKWAAEATSRPTEKLPSLTGEESLTVFAHYISIECEKGRTSTGPNDTREYTCTHCDAVRLNPWRLQKHKLDMGERKDNRNGMKMRLSESPIKNNTLNRHALQLKSEQLAVKVKADYHEANKEKKKKEKRVPTTVENIMAELRRRKVHSIQVALCDAVNESPYVNESMRRKLRVKIDCVVDTIKAMLLYTCVPLDEQSDKKKGHRFHRNTKYVIEVAALLGGRKSAMAIAQNMMDVSPKTIQRIQSKTLVSVVPGIHVSYFEHVATILSTMYRNECEGYSKEEKEKKGYKTILHNGKEYVHRGSLAQLSGDESAVQPGEGPITVRDKDSDKKDKILIVGFCGKADEGSLKREHKECDFSYQAFCPKSPDGEVKTPAQAKESLKLVDSLVSGHYARVIVLNILDERGKKIVLVVNATCNRFTAETLQTQEKELESALRKSPLWDMFHFYSLASDGDARRRLMFTAMMMYFGDNHFTLLSDTFVHSVNQRECLCQDRIYRLVPFEVCCSGKFIPHKADEVCFNLNIRFSVLIP